MIHPGDPSLKHSKYKFFIKFVSRAADLKIQGCGRGMRLVTVLVEEYISKELQCYGFSDLRQDVTKFYRGTKVIHRGRRKTMNSVG